MFSPNKSGLAVNRRSRFLTPANPRSPRSLTIGIGERDAGVAEAEAWERFREAGLLDESELRRKDREALAQRIQELEQELYDYQHHMGLLLIEKEKRTLENEEIRQKLSEAEEIFKRERMTQLIAMSELEKRQENTQNALAVAKQRVNDVKIQKLLDDHRLSMDLRKQDFDMELDKKRECFEQCLKEKLDAMEKKKAEINFREDQILIREDSLRGEMDKLKNKEEEIDTKLTLLKVKEESVHKEHQKVKVAEDQLRMEAQKLLMSKAELESLTTGVNTEKQQIIMDKEDLKLMQLDGKQEIDNCRIMKESLLKEAEILNLDRHKVQREMDAQDERRTSLATELKLLNQDREAFNDWRCTAEEKLRNERLKIRFDVEQGAEEFRLKELALEKDQSDISRDLQSRMLALEEMEKTLREKEIDIERRKTTNQSIIKSPTFVDESNFPKQKTDQDRLVGEQKEISTKRIKLKTDHFEMFNIDTVQKDFENEQEELINVRDNFLPVAELCKICKNCGVTVSELDFTRIQTPSRPATERNIFLEDHTSGSPTILSSGHFPLLRKCSEPTLLDGEASKSKTRTDRTNSGTGAMDTIVSERLFNDEDEPEAPLGIADTGISNSGGRPNFSFIEVKDKRDETASKSLSANQRGKLPSRRRGRPKIVRNIYSDRAGVEDAKGIHVEMSQEKGQQTSEREVFADIDEGRQGDLVHADQMDINVGQKLDFHLTSEDEVFSEDLSGGDRGKHQTSAPGTPNSGEKRYNFRLSTIRKRRDRN